MECEVCKPKNAQDDSVEETGKFCGHESSCDCEEPERPTGLPECEGSDPSDPSGCDPSLEIARRKREIAAAEADVADRTKALEALEAKSTLLAEAKAAYQQDAAQREERRKACKEFVDCKRPDLPSDDRDCVEKAIEDYDDLLHSYERYIRYVIWKLGRASAKTARLDYALKRAEDHFDWVRDKASSCLKECGTLKEHFDQAVADNKPCEMYLYWRLAEQMLNAGSSGCVSKTDYHDHLCRAFEHLCDVTDAADKARSKESSLRALKDSIILEYESVKSNRISTIADQVAKCCCRPKSKKDDLPSSPTETEQSSAT